MTRRAVFAALLGAAGLALYLWPAVTAPVVLWSDSQTDLDWAIAGEGIVGPAGTKNGASLKKWVGRSTSFVATLPVKKKKPAKKKH